MRHSCGALLYTFHPKSGEIGIILGLEKSHWLPFKGGNKNNESYEAAAIREVYEETCGLLKLTTINLEHHFHSKSKQYHIGLCHADYSIVDQFLQARKKQTKKDFQEKEKIQFFSLKDIMNGNHIIHKITMASVYYFWDRLTQFDNSNDRVRNHYITSNELIQDSNLWNDKISSDDENNKSDDTSDTSNESVKKNNQSKINIYKNISYNNRKPHRYKYRSEQKNAASISQDWRVQICI